MTADNFARSLAKTLVYEGGNDDDPRDPGGRTSRGITQSEYDIWRVKRLLTKRDVWTAGDDEVAAIYRDEYWAKGRCDDLPVGIDFATFDANVNSGLGNGARWLQQALNDNGVPVDIDGAVGPQTTTAANGAPDKPAVVRAETARRSTFLHGLKTWVTFGKGWGTRVADVEATGVQMALEATSLSKGEVADALNKAADDAKTSRTTARSGAGAGAAGGVATQFDPNLPHWLVFLGIAVAVVAVVYFALKAQLHRQRTDAYAAAAKTVTIGESK